MKLTLIILALALSGCTTVADRSWIRCELLKIAFSEQDELAPGWYDAVVKELQHCNMGHDDDAAKGRGRGA